MVVDVNDSVGDFTIYLPLSLSEDILGQLDICSLSSASQVSRTWNELISESDYIWRIIYKSLTGTEDYLALNAMSYKTLAIQRYITLKNKAKWLNGSFSNINSYKDLKNMPSQCKFSKTDWEDILQCELNR
ncbi:F-box only protein 48-like [Clavelina lepadiformis]|uniref:F-box domain-containing protein n=1 Tax=Clavelina lepadiformis TaxID=159417 RepID=A0ABP0GKM1_CLALP